MLQHLALGHFRVEQADSYIGEAHLVIGGNLLYALFGAAHQEGIVHQRFKVAGNLAGQLAVGAVQSVLGIDLIFRGEICLGSSQGLFAGRSTVKLTDDDHVLGLVVAVGFQGTVIQVNLVADGLVGLSRADIQDFALASDALHGRVAHGRLPDLGVRLLVGAGSGAGIGDLIVATVVGNFVLAPQPAHQAHGLGAAGAALGHTGAESLAFLGPVAQADTQDEASLGDVVQRGGLFRHVHGVEQRKQQNRGRQLHVARLPSQPRQDGPRLEVLEGVYQVVVRPAVDVEPGIAGRPELRQVVLPLLLVVNGVPLDDMAYLVAYAH